VLVLRDRHAPESTYSEALRRGPPPARLRRATADQLQSAADTRRARPARSQRACSGTQCYRTALPPTSAAGKGGCRAWTAHGMLVSRDRDAPVAANRVAVWRCPLPVASAAGEEGCISRTARGMLVSRNRDLLAAAPSAALWRSLEGDCRARTARGTWHACLVLSRRASGSTQCVLAAQAFAGEARVGDYRGRTRKERDT
jgi:hypothetical protein